MRFLGAFKAERVPAFALNITYTIFLVLYTIVTALKGTPSHTFIIVSE
jgi:hypothetical protein